MSLLLRLDGSFAVDGVHYTRGVTRYADHVVTLAEGYLLSHLFEMIEASPEEWAEVLGCTERSIHRWLRAWRLPTPYVEDDDPLVRIEVSYTRERDRSGSWACCGWSEVEPYCLSYAALASFKHLPIRIKEEGTEYFRDREGLRWVEFPIVCTLRELVTAMWRELCGFDDPLDAAEAIDRTLSRVDRNEETEDRNTEV